MSRILHFARHYLEMVIVMFVGMIVVGASIDLGLRIAGIDGMQLQADHPAGAMAYMCVIMTVPMVAWMRRRGHRWQPSLEMGASMVAPTAAVIVLYWAGTVERMSTLMVLEHGGMFASMLAAMLIRAGEYSGHAGHAHEAGDAGLPAAVRAQA